MGTQKLCACDQTSQSPIRVDIDLIDTVQQPFAAVVNGLSEVTKEGIWLNPFRGIPRGPRPSRFDVIYLDENCRVIAFAENFAEFEFEPIAEQAASALVLPAHTLASTHVQRGDQLRICRGTKALAGFDGASLLADPKESFRCAKNGELPASPAAMPNREKRDVRAETGLAVGIEEKPSLKVRFLRWLFPEAASTDRRRGERLPAPGLVAFYWTGGAPTAYQLGNVSRSGLYLLTEERWLPGTRIMMTLQKENGGEASSGDISRVESKVIRWGEDGVGCEFVQSGFVDLNTGGIEEGREFERQEFEKFLGRVVNAAAEHTSFGSRLR
jgi:hypothetical protein